MMLDEILLENVMEYRQKKLDIEAMKKEKDALEETLKSEMEARNTEDLIVGVFKVSYKEYSRKVFDRQKFMTDWPDLYKNYVKTQKYKALTVA